VRIWDAQTMQPTQSFNAYPATHPAAVWSPDGQKVAVAQGRDFVQLHDLDGGGDPQTFNLPGTTRALLWLPSGEIAGSDLKGKVAFFQQGKADPVRAYEPATSHKAVNSLSLSPDGQLLAIGYDDGAIILIDPTTAKQVREFPKGRRDLFRRQGQAARQARCRLRHERRELVARRPLGGRRLRRSHLQDLAGLTTADAGDAAAHAAQLHGTLSVIC